MDLVAVDHALVHTSGQQLPSLIRGEAHKSRTGVGVGVGTHEKGQKERREGFRSRLPHPAVQKAVNALPPALRLRLRLRQQGADDPFQVPGGGGAALLDEIVFRQAEEGVHGHPPVRHRTGPQVLVDAPGPGDHTNVPLIQHPRRQGAGIDIKHAPQHRGPFIQSAALRRLPGNTARDLVRAAQGREGLRQILQAVEGQEDGIILPGMQIHRPGAGTVRQFSPGFAGEAEADVILAPEGPPDLRNDFRLMVPEPGKQGHGLAGHDMLTGTGKSPLLRSILPPAVRIGVGPVVRGEDPVPGGLSVPAPEVETFPVAAHRHAGDLRRADAAARHRFPDDGAVCLPHLLHVPLKAARRGGQHRRIPGGGAQFPSPDVVQSGFGGGAAVIHPKITFHLSSSPRNPGSGYGDSPSRQRSRHRSPGPCGRYSTGTPRSGWPHGG